MTHRFEWGVRPQLLACRAEHCKRQSPARLHRAPHVRKGGHWIAKKHDSKARECQLEAVAMPEFRGAPQSFGSATRARSECLCTLRVRPTVHSLVVARIESRAVVLARLPPGRTRRAPIPQRATYSVSLH